MTGLPAPVRTTCNGLLLLLGLCFADSARGQTDITVLGGYRSSGRFEQVSNDARVDVNDTATRGLVLNIDDRPNSAYEFLYSKQASRLTAMTPVPGTPLFDIDIEYIHMGGILLKPLNDHARSFFGAGIGLTHFSPGLSGLDSETRPSFSITGGIKFMLNPHLGFRLDLRGYATAVESNTALFCRDGGCVVRFSGDMFTQFEGSAGITWRF